MILISTSVSFAQEKKSNFRNKTIEMEWTDYDQVAARAAAADRTNGISYIISGGVALVGGIAGANVTSDPLEKGVYALFQTIGIASIGYGAYKWKIGDEDRLLMNSLHDSRDLSDAQKISFLKVYNDQKKELLRQERYIKAITHGLIAALNIYNASQQTQDGVKNTLYFVGGANLLASLSYTF
ncbi:MAG: hypothetical protein H7328_03920 [Bdellovibrio sp.]|nr:hypothetical protein [Bdellovibrio sp.]